MNRVRTVPPRHGRRLGILALGALGVVYGDIGTSVLYAVSAAFDGTHGVAVNRANILGILSLIFWALVLVVGVKYLAFVMRADNGGEGGVLALLALLAPRRRPASRRKAWLISTGLIGAALLYGDGVITPAISVLAAVEGLALENPALQNSVVPAAVAVLIVLFLAQHRGTGRLGTVFGPIMLIWFASIALLGIGGITREPHVLLAANPLHAVRFLTGHGAVGFLVLGAVVLTITGVEALYADLGQFGAAPIRVGWFGLVFPALLLNYFGQGAVLLVDPRALESPFYALAPPPLHYATVALATFAAIIASQAVISGAFSLTRQAIQLGYLPRATIRHTSTAMPGQVYIPEVNILLMVACVGLVLAFRESSRLAAAYGMAVAGTMTITTILFFFVMRERRRWGIVQAGALALAFLTIDLAFLGANITKIPHGAWIPLVVAAGVYTLMSTWRSGVDRLAASLAPVSVDSFLRELAGRPPVRVPGVAVLLSTSSGAVPPELIHYTRRNRVLQERVILLVVSAVDIPRIPAAQRLEVQPLAAGVVQVCVRYGFMESPDVPRALECTDVLAGTRPEDVTFLIGRATLARTARPGMAQWRKALFAFLWLTSRPARLHWRLPPGQVVEVGMEIEL